MHHLVHARAEADRRGAADAVQQQGQQAALREVGDGLRADARVQRAALPLHEWSAAQQYASADKVVFAEMDLSAHVVPLHKDRAAYPVRQQVYTR